jgi:hypothetical protein
VTQVWAHDEKFNLMALYGVILSLSAHYPITLCTQLLSLVSVLQNEIQKGGGRTGRSVS